MKQLEGKVAIVTGASSGIGQAIAELYAQAGAKVVVSDVQDEAGKAVVSAIQKAGGEAIYVHADVSKAEDCKALVDQTIEAYGALHIACNNAGVGGNMTFTADQDLDAWNRVININLNGVFYCMKYQIAAMLEAGEGAIVNISSILGQVGFAGAAAYVSSKHALLGLGRAAALEYGTKNIRVNTVGPAFIRTPMLEALDQEVLDTQIAPLHALGRLGEPSEVAELVLWLSSAQASFATGAYYPIDGGYLAR